MIKRLDKSLLGVLTILIAMIASVIVAVPSYASDHLHFPVTSISFETMPSTSEKGSLNVTFTVPEHKDGDTYYSGLSYGLVNVETGKYIGSGVMGGWTDVLTEEEQAQLYKAPAGSTYTGVFQIPYLILDENYFINRKPLLPEGNYRIDIHNNGNEPILSTGVIHCGVDPSTRGDYNSPLEAFVGRLYENVLGREADDAGLFGWETSLIRKEKTGSEVALGFFMSQEMTDRNLPDEDYVKVCYQTMLGREADEAGLASWVAKLENGFSREAVLYGFSNSTEFDNMCKEAGIERGSLSSKQNRDQNYGITSFTARCYTKALGRKFDVAGLNDWTGKILEADNKKNMAEKVASDGFFHSQEFANKNTSNEEYVEILYRTFLGREYDDKGKADWVGKLDSGVSRDEVLYGFSRSQEFSNIMATYGL